MCYIAQEDFRDSTLYNEINESEIEGMKIISHDYERDHQLENDKRNKREVYKSYLEAEHEVVNLKEQNNEKNIYFYEILKPKNQIETQQQLLLSEEKPKITQEIYLTKDIDAREDFHMRSNTVDYEKLNQLSLADKK